MLDVKIKPETVKDHQAVFELNHRAFGGVNEANLVERLRKNKNYIPELSLVATADNNIAGHILFTRISIVNDNKEQFESLALAPMAVHPDFQYSGIGGQLITKGLTKARELSFKSVIVLGHENYYPKFGFKPASEWNIFTAYDVPTNYFMALELIENGLKGVSGTVLYPEEFSSIPPQ